MYEPSPSEQRELFLPPATLDLNGLEDPTESRNLYRRIQAYFRSDPLASPPMSPLEREALNPCEKLRRYGKFPWKLTIHVILVSLTTVMVWLWSSNDALHIRHSAAHFHRVLLGVSGSKPEERQVEIATSQDLKDQIDKNVEAYWAIGDSKLTDYSLCKGPLVVEIDRTGNLPSSTIELTADTWRTNAEYQKATSDISSDIEQISLSGLVHDIFDGPHWHQCVRWSLRTEYKYGGSGLVIGSLEYGITECSKNGSTNYEVPLTVLFFATLSVILVTKSEISRRQHLFGRRKSVSKWFLFTIAANGLQILASLACMRLIRRTDVNTRFSLIGLSAIAAWISVLKYLRYFHVYYVLVRTLSKAVPRCMRFVTGVSPILIGYALLGNCLFYQSAMFTTIGGSIATLFSLLNGDIIRDTFSDIGQLVPFWGELYLYTFLCLFIYVVLHIFISIVEESYFTAKHHSETPGEFYMHDTAELVLETTDTEPASGSSGIATYIVNKIKGELSTLRSMSALDEKTKRDLINILSE